MDKSIIILKNKNGENKSVHALKYNFINLLNLI